MVSPYLSRPLRTLREALESHQAQRRAGAAEARPGGGLLGEAEAQAARPEAADSLTLPLVPRRPFTVVTGGGPGPSRGSGGA